MIIVHHVLKNGIEVDDIAGKVIKADEFGLLYEVINRIQKEGDQNTDDQNSM